MTTSLRATPLHSWHLSQKARMAEFAGYDMPIQYTTIVTEHQATRQQVTLFDISHMGRFRFEGSRSVELLDHLLTRRVRDMVPGQIRYSLVTNVDGGILDDVLVYCLESPSGRNYFLLVVNASNREKVVAWLRTKLPPAGVTLMDRTSDTAMIAVQGPVAIDIVCQLCDPLEAAQIRQLGNYRATTATVAGQPAAVSRTGYTGEDGVELIVAAAAAVPVWDAVYAAGASAGLLACGLGARDTLRLEAGMPLYGHELRADSDPFAIGLDLAVNLEGRSFPGSGRFAALRDRPAGRVRVGLAFDSKRSAREGNSVWHGDREVGVVTSGSFSPTLQRSIAMSMVDRDVATAGTALDVLIRDTRQAATVAPLPFYRRLAKAPALQP